MSTLELCQKYFDTRDVYKLFKIEKAAVEKDIKKAYHKLSLLVHPDRVPESQKEAATEKFKLLSKLYQMLTDKDKRALYDEQGIIDDDDDYMGGKINNWLEFWKNLFTPLTDEAITNYEKSYVGSDLEKADIKKAYLSGKGCINHMISSVPFMKVESEARMQEVVKEMIALGEVPEYKLFTEEPQQKRKRRHQKYARESKKAAEIKAKIDAKNKTRSNSEGANSTPSGSNLEQAIMAGQKSRNNSFNTLMDKLLEKYGNEDEDDVIDLNNLDKIKKLKKKPKKIVKKGSDSSPLHALKSGKVKKR